ncbi:conserved Plasmodium protein, unknown function [Plasmodium chabaudi adami]|uniref:HTH OST-type domain-containing protein n=1 Tax=Plasmodium chabaudi adami TaxID=5826 RepID=A0A1D3RXY3_PLACE|nr:conserved Plasmodium protein, unknown function [Plasmodium chabaudi adami]
MDTEPSSSLNDKKPSPSNIFTEKSDLEIQKNTEIENSNDQVLSANTNDNLKNSSNDANCENENTKKKIGTTLNKLEDNSASIKNEKKTDSKDEENLEVNTDKIGLNVQNDGNESTTLSSEKNINHFGEGDAENKTEKPHVQKYESKLNPIAPEFKPQNSLYIYQKIQQHTKRNIILLIKSFGYKGIKLEKISGEYCKKYNAVLNLGQAGFTNIYDILKSLNNCLIYEYEENENNKNEKENDHKTDIPVAKSNEELEKNLIVKYKTPKMNEDREFFVKIILGTIAEYTNYNPKLTNEETPLNNNLSLNKLPQEIKKIFGQTFNIKALQIRCGIYKLQTFLEEIQEIEIFSFSNDIKIRITPETYYSKIPQLKNIKKSMGSNELKIKSLYSRFSSKKSSNYNQFIENKTNIKLDDENSNIIKKTTSQNNDEKNIQNKIDKLDSIEIIKTINSRNNSINRKNDFLHDINVPLYNSKSCENNWKSIFLGQNNNPLFENHDLNYMSKTNNIDKYEDYINKYDTKFSADFSRFKNTHDPFIYHKGLVNSHPTYFSQFNKDTENKNLLPRILPKTQLHILLFQLIVILSARQKIEWTEINKIKEQILRSGNETNETEGSPNQNETDTKSTVEEPESYKKEKTNILDILNNSGTTVSSDYLNGSYKTQDTSNMYKHEVLSSDMNTKNSHFFNSNELDDTENELIGVFVSSIKSEWNKTYSDQYPLSFYLNYYKTKKLKKLLEEIPNLIIAGYGRTMQVITLDAAQEYYDNFFSDDQSHFKAIAKSKFTSLSSAIYFKDATYKEIAEECINGNTSNVFKILEINYMKLPNSNKNINNYNFIHDESIGRKFSKSMDNLVEDYDLNESREKYYGYKNYNKKKNLEILRYHLHKLLYNLVIHVCKKQNSLFLKYKENGIILNEEEINKQLCAPISYQTDLTYDDFIMPKQNFIQKYNIAKNMHILSQYGIYGIKLIHLPNEWFNLYKCELRPLMKICNYFQIGKMISTMSNLLVVDEGFDTKYIPNINLDLEVGSFNDLSFWDSVKMPPESALQNKIYFPESHKGNINNPTSKSPAYESIMGVLFPNSIPQRSNKFQRNNTTHIRPFKNYDYKKNKSSFPGSYNSYKYKNSINLHDLFRNL